MAGNNQATLRKAMNTVARVRVPTPAPLDNPLSKAANQSSLRGDEVNRLRIDGNRNINTRKKENEAWENIGDALGQYVSGAARTAINHKCSNGTQAQQIEALRYYYGNYTAEELADMPDNGETALWFPLIEMFVKRMYAFIIDTMTSEKGVPQYDMRPTTVPDIPPLLLERALESITQQVLLAIETGVVVTGTQLREAVEGMTDTLFEEAKASAEYAVRKCKRETDDRLDQSNYFQAFLDGVFDSVLCGTGIIYGPYPVLEQRATFGPDSRPEYGYHKNMQWRSLDKLYLFPSVCSTDTQDGEYLIYLDKMSRKQLYEAKSCPGWLPDNIEYILREHPSGWSSCQSGMFGDIQALRGSAYGRPDSRYDTTWYIGCIPGKFLLELGIETYLGRAVEDIGSYEVEIWTIAGLPVKVQLPLDPKCERPVHRAVMFEDAGSFWGRGTYHRLCDLQRLINSAFTSIPYDLGYTAFPVWEIDRGMMKQEDQEDVGAINIFPGAVFEKDSLQSGVAGNMIGAHQTQSNVGLFMNMMQEVIEQAETLMGLPRYLSGGAQGSGALRTASGLAQLQSNAFINLKCIIRNYDMGFTAPAIGMLHRYIAATTDDPDLMGDVEVVILGHTVMLARQVHRDSLAQNLGLFMPFMQAGVIPMEGVLDFLREIASIGGYDPRKLVPDSQYESAKAQELQAALQSIGGISGGVPGLGAQLTGGGPLPAAQGAGLPPGAAGSAPQQQVTALPPGV